jgi:hypothetical protein
MRSSFIDWILEQNMRSDNIGVISRWVISEPNFEPVEFHDILEKVDNKELRGFAIEALVEYAGEIAEQGLGVKIIDEKEIDQERLNIAISQENYEEAAKLRDRLIKLRQETCNHDKGYVTNDGPSRCILCGKPWI